MMSIKNQTPSDAISIELHPLAQKLALEYVDSFASSLVLQAKLIAYRAKAEVVLSSHIEESLEAVRTRDKKIWTRELLLVLGSAFFGAFIQGFIAELSNGNKTLVAIYTILGFIGLILVFLGLQRK